MLYEHDFLKSKFSSFKNKIFSIDLVFVNIFLPFKKQHNIKEIFIDASRKSSTAFNVLNNIV